MTADLATRAEATVLAAPEERVEGREKVTGAARYAMDVAMPGALWAAFVGCPYPHARVVRVDASRALAMPGVRAVITGKDTARTRFGRRLQDWPILAHDRARFIGERVAAIAADTRELADEAARAVDVEYEELPAVLTVDAALADGATVLHPDRASYRFLGAPAPPEVPHPNVQGNVIHEHGDVAAGFAAAARVFEHTFRYGRNHQGYLEPRASIVWLEGDRVRVITTNKAPFALRAQLAAALGIPEERIVVDAGYIGGDFGGKGLSIEEPALYFLARATRRPVRSLLSLGDDLQVTNPRHGGTLTLRTAVDAEGRILAHHARVVLDGGAYAAGKPQPGLIPGDAGLLMPGYHIPAARVEVTSVYTNNEPAGHVRSPGQPQTSFASDSHIDEIAREMGIDPLEIRRRNAIQPGQLDIHGHEWHDHLSTEVLETLGREMRWSEPPKLSGLVTPSALGGPAVPDRRVAVGRGIGYCVRHVGRGKTNLEIEVGADGCVNVITGAPDQGGGAYTMLQRIVAAELGLPPHRVRVRRGDTSETLFDPGVGGSRFTPVAGGAAQEGARRLRTELEKISADLDEAMLQARGKLRLAGTFDQTQSRYSVCAYGLTVAVDRDTGQIRVIDAVLVVDTGTVINPVAHRGQLEGAFVFGLGQTVMEDLRIEDGRVVTANLDSYKIPTMPDVPPLRIVLLTEDTGPGPFGVKSVGELGNAAVGPAVANAIRDAVGVRIWSIPITAEGVLQAIHDGHDAA